MIERVRKLYHRPEDILCLHRSPREQSEQQEVFSSSLSMLLEA